MKVEEYMFCECGCEPYEAECPLCDGPTVEYHRPCDCCPGWTHVECPECGEGYRWADEPPVATYWG